MEYKIGDYIKTKKPTATMEVGTCGVICDVNKAGLAVDYIGYGTSGVPHDDARWFLEKIEPLDYLRYGLTKTMYELNKLSKTTARLIGQCEQILYTDVEEPHENI